MNGEGNAKRFRCPYHSWSYRLDGRLEHAPEMHETHAFDLGDYGLKPIRLETWAGFLFITFDPGCADLMTFLGDLPELTAPYRFEDMTCVRRKVYDLACNWKIYVENAMEAYHVPTVHMQTISRQKRENSPAIPSAGGYCGIFTRHEGSRAILPGEAGFPHLPTLSGQSAQGTYYILIYPSTMFGCTLDCMWWLELHPRGPEQTRLVVGSCFPDETIARDDFDALIPNYYRRWETSIAEDNAISEQQQAGMRSPFLSPGRLSHLEPLVHTLANWCWTGCSTPTTEGRYGAAEGRAGFGFRGRRYGASWPRGVAAVASPSAGGVRLPARPKPGMEPFREPASRRSSGRGRVRVWGRREVQVRRQGGQESSRGESAAGGFGSCIPGRDVPGGCRTSTT